MGNTPSEIKQQFYILKVSNKDLPLCPFIHAIIKYNNQPIIDTDPRIFKEILVNSDLVLDIVDIRDNSTFSITIPKGTEKLGLNVMKIKDSISLMKIRINNVREGCPFQINDQILGIENVYSEDEDTLIRNIKNSIGKMLNLIIIRKGCVIVQEIDVKGDLGCEIGIGMLYSVDENEYFIEGYNKTIKKAIIAKEKPIFIDSSSSLDNPSEIKESAIIEANPEDATLSSKPETKEIYSETVTQKENRIETQHFQGKSGETENKTYVVNGNLVNAQDFINDNGTIKMKNQQYTERKANILESSQGCETSICEDFEVQKDLEALKLGNEQVSIQSQPDIVKSSIASNPLQNASPNLPQANYIQPAPIIKQEPPICNSIINTSLKNEPVLNNPPIYSTGSSNNQIPNTAQTHIAGVPVRENYFIEPSMQLEKNKHSNELNNCDIKSSPNQKLLESLEHNIQGNSHQDSMAFNTNNYNQNALVNNTDQKNPGPPQKSHALQSSTDIEKYNLLSAEDPNFSNRILSPQINSNNSQPVPHDDFKPEYISNDMVQDQTNGFVKDCFYERTPQAVFDHEINNTPSQNPPQPFCEQESNLSVKEAKLLYEKQNNFQPTPENQLFNTAINNSGSKNNIETLFNGTEDDEDLPFISKKDGDSFKSENGPNSGAFL